MELGRLAFAGESGGNTDGQTAVTEGSKTEVGKTSSKSATKSAASISKKSTEKVTEPGSDLHKTASGDSASQEKAASQAVDGEDGTERSESCPILCSPPPDCNIFVVSAEAEKTMDDDQASEATKGPRYGVNETPVSKANTTTSSKGSKQTKKSKKSEKEKEKEEERVKSAAKPQVERSSVVHVTRTCCEQHVFHN